MDIRCPNCETLYAFDDSKVKRKAFSVKCSTCAHIFRVELTPDASAPEPAPPLADAAPSPRWMLRPADGEPTRGFDDMTTLQTWIMEQRVRPADAISKNGAVWKTLDSIPELASLFEVAQKLGAPAAAAPQAEFFDPNAPGAPVSPPLPPAAPTSGGDPSADLSDPLGVDLSAELGPIQPLTLGGFTQSAELDDVDLGAPAPNTPSSSAAPLLALIAIALIAAAGVFVYTARPELLGLTPDRAAAPSPSGEADTAPPEPATGADDATAQRPDDADEADAGADAADLAAAAEADAGDPKAPLKKDAEAAAAAPSEPSKPAAKAPPAKHDPNAALSGSYDVLINRAYQLRQQGRMDRAAQAFKMAISKRPSSSEAHAGLGWAYFGMGNASQAAQSFQQAIQLNPRYANAHFGLGRAYQAMGQNAKAIECYNTCLRISPSGPSAELARKLIAGLGGTPPP